MTMGRFSAFFRRKILFTSSLIPALAICALVSARAYAAPPIPNDTVMVGTGNGLVTEYTQAGVFITQINTTTGSFEETGSVFDASGNFFTTDFTVSNVTKFDPSGTLIGSFGSGYSDHPESITFDAAGNFYVG